MYILQYRSDGSTILMLRVFQSRENEVTALASAKRSVYVIERL